MLRSSNGVPNRPVSNGRNGWFIGKENVAIPSAPANRKRARAQNLEDLSFSMRVVEAIMRMKGMKFLMRGYAVFRKGINMGVSIAVVIIAAVEPIIVK